MSDMLVKLYELPEMPQTGKDYRIIRPLAPDRFRVVEWVNRIVERMLQESVRHALPTLL